MNIKNRNSRLVLGGLLIILGVLILVETQTDLSPWIWVAVLTVGGLVVYAAYVMDRSEKWLLIISYTMLAVAGLVALLELGVLKDSLVATYVLAAIALPFLVAFFLNRKNWGYLIPAYVLLAIGVMVPLIEMEVLEDAWIATYVMLAIALPFIVAFLNNRTYWAFLIPAYVLTAIGIMVPLIEMDVLSDTMIATYILLAIAIPFLVVYVLDTKKWWALIPGGILVLIGLGFLIAEASVEYILAAGMIVFGILIIVRQFTKSAGRGGTEALPEEETRDA